VKKITTYIADDSTVVRERLVEMLAMFDTVEVIGQAANGKDALGDILNLHPDVALLDINMPGLNGIDVMMQVKSVNPGIKVILFTSYSATDFGEECMKRGADFFFQSNNVNALLELFGTMQNTLKDSKIQIQEKQ